MSVTHNGCKDILKDETGPCDLELKECEEGIEDQSHTPNYYCAYPPKLVSDLVLGIFFKVNWISVLRLVRQLVSLAANSEKDNSGQYTDEGTHPNPDIL